MFTPSDSYRIGCRWLVRWCYFWLGDQQPFVYKPLPAAGSNSLANSLAHNSKLDTFANFVFVADQYGLPKL